MSWDKEQAKERQTEPVTQPAAPTETTPENKPVVSAPATVKAETKPESADATQLPPASNGEGQPDDDAMVPQKIIGRVVKKVREKSRAAIQASEEKIKALEEENRKLKENVKGFANELPPILTGDEDAKIAEKVRLEFLRRQWNYGAQKYGKDSWQDACDLINQQNDPALAAKIDGAADPADTLWREAIRIAQELEWGETPEERERKRLAMLEAEIRKKLEAEFAAKLAARGNQPSDVQNVRAAGSYDGPKPTIDSWATSLPK